MSFTGSYLFSGIDIYLINKSSLLFAFCHFGTLLELKNCKYATSLKCLKF